MLTLSRYGIVVTRTEDQARRQIGRQIIKAKRMCRAVWRNDYNLKDVLVLMNASSSGEQKRLLDFFYANRQTKSENWWRMADFKIELIRSIIPRESEDYVVSRLVKQNEIRERRRLLWFEDPDHQVEIAQLETSREKIAQEIESELEGHELAITNSDIVSTFRTLGWDA